MIKMNNLFNTIYIYVPATRQIIRISEGTGDNLLYEDREDGYVDYIYYEQYEFGENIEEADGGQVMLTELFRDKYKCTAACIPDVLDMAYGNSAVGYITL
jgi:hypothetical protein